MKRKAKSITDILRSKKEVFPFEGAWKDAFSQPEVVGVWVIWGESGNGKSSFVMQLCKELTRYKKVLYNSLEEGDSLTFQNTLKRFEMDKVRGRMHVVTEGADALKERLRKDKCYKIVIIDSLQYFGIDYKEYKLLKEEFRDRLFIFISHAEGKKPDGRTANKVRYDASLKIFVQGYKAFSNGRFFGEVGNYTIWEEKANEYWGLPDVENKNVK